MKKWMLGAALVAVAGVAVAAEASLDKFKVREKEQKELFAIVESTKGDIVTRKKEGG